MAEVKPRWSENSAVWKSTITCSYCKEQLTTNGKYLVCSNGRSCPKFGQKIYEKKEKNYQGEN
jgi:hypothetical protein